MKEDLLNGENFLKEHLSNRELINECFDIEQKLQYIAKHIDVKLAGFYLLDFPASNKPKDNTTDRANHQNTARSYTND